jgi:ATP-dependent Clp protease adaptor protein ClpS
MDPNETAAEPVVPESDQDTATATMVPEKKKERKRKKREVPRYHVLLWDSDHHSYEYVERMLRELFGHTQETCHQMAVQVDTRGKVIVLTTTKEHAELKRDQIIAYGKDDNIKNCTGSMHSTIESAG